MRKDRTVRAAFNRLSSSSATLVGGVSSRQRAIGQIPWTTTSPCSQGLFRASRVAAITSPRRASHAAASSQCDFLDRNTYSATLRPVEESTSLLPLAYHDPAFYELEKKKIFSKMWVFAGYTTELPQVSSYAVSLDYFWLITLILRNRLQSSPNNLIKCTARRHKGCRVGGTAHPAYARQARHNQGILERVPPQGIEDAN